MILSQSLEFVFWSATPLLHSGKRVLLSPADNNFCCSAAVRRLYPLCALCLAEGSMMMATYKTALCQPTGCKNRPSLSRVGHCPCPGQPNVNLVSCLFCVIVPYGLLMHTCLFFFAFSALTRDVKREPVTGLESEKPVVDFA